MTGGTGACGFHLLVLFFCDVPGLKFVAPPMGIGAAAQGVAAPTSCQHGTARHKNSGQIHREGAH